MSTRRNRLIGGVCEQLGDVFPSLGAHLIVFAEKG
jgi:phage shock protein PspC (stress-responsive transcriptional regulator)